MLEKPPDMSVNRGAPLGEPEWVLLESEDCASWGIIFFEVQANPSPLKHVDGAIYEFRPVHVPLEENYPHSEIRAFQDEKHVQARKLIDPDMSLRWRNILLQRTHTHRRPAES